MSLYSFTECNINTYEYNIVMVFWLFMVGKLE